MIITLSLCTANFQAVAEVQLTGVAPLGAVSQRFNLIMAYADDANLIDDDIRTIERNPEMLLIACKYILSDSPNYAKSSHT